MDRSFLKALFESAGKILHVFGYRGRQLAFGQNLVGNAGRKQ
jgi:hypothetical protein